MRLASTTRTVLLTIVVLIPLGLAGAFLVTWSGLYSVAASSGHFAIVRRFLAFALTQSVKTQSFFIEPPPDFDRPSRVVLGAGHFQGGCQPCHGAPGKAPNPVVRQMLPDPPPLADKVGRWRDRELFWIVKHGIKYTGMPSWPAPSRDDEVWAVAAFLRKLPQLSPAAYERLARGNAAAIERSPEQLIVAGPPVTALAACARCHGDPEVPPASALVPRLAGQKARYLEHSLKSYAAGTRYSGIMQPVAAQLSERQVADLSRYYAGLIRNAMGAASASSAAAHPALGEELATKGAPGSGIPPCLACHRRGSAELFPLLEGQSAQYIESQLRLFKAGDRGSTPTALIMSTIARRLSSEQIGAVAAWWENRSAMTRSTRSEEPVP